MRYGYGWTVGVAAGLLAWPTQSTSGLLDTIGVMPIRNEDPSLTGSGVRAAQPEAGSPIWEVNPAAVSQPSSLFTWTSSSGSSSTYPNGLGQESGHADAVGTDFYNPVSGVSPGIASLDNYDATYFALTLIPSLTAIRAQVVNQSFVVGTSLPIGPGSESQYDNYVATYNKVIVSGVGNGGPPQLPATAYNVVAVGAYGGASSIGPTTNGGRAKPDLTAPADATSFSTPLVAGAAVLLFQSAARNDAGAGTAATATNAITLKTLLLNGAVKPSDWTNSTTTPLDARYGAGVLNAYNSWLQLRSGKKNFIESSSPSVGGNHFPASNTNTIALLRGWDNNSVSSSAINDGVNHYYFTLDAAQSTRFSLTATLVWNRQAGQSDINNLDLFLYNTANSNLITSCQSAVDNVEHIFLPSLPAGRYDLQVLKHGGIGIVSLGETYALAFDFEPVKLAISASGTNVLVSWPASSSGFNLQVSPDVGTANSWNLIAASPVQTNGQYVVRSPLVNGPQFFRLTRP